MGKIGGRQLTAAGFVFRSDELISTANYLLIKHRRLDTMQANRLSSEATVVGGVLRSPRSTASLSLSLLLLLLLSSLLPGALWLLFGVRAHIPKQKIDLDTNFPTKPYN